MINKHKWKVVVTIFAVILGSICLSLQLLVLSNIGVVKLAALRGHAAPLPYDGYALVEIKNSNIVGQRVVEGLQVGWTGVIAGWVYVVIGMVLGGAAGYLLGDLRLRRYAKGVKELIACHCAARNEAQRIASEATAMVMKIGKREEEVLKRERQVALEREKIRSHRLDDDLLPGK